LSLFIFFFSLKRLDDKNGILIFKNFFLSKKEVYLNKLKKSKNKNKQKVFDSHSFFL